MLLSSADPRTSGSLITLVTASHHHMSHSLSLRCRLATDTLFTSLRPGVGVSRQSGRAHRPLPHSTEGWVIVIIWADYSAYSYQLSPPQYSSGSQKLTQVHCTLLQLCMWGGHRHQTPVNMKTLASTRGEVTSKYWTLYLSWHCKFNKYYHIHTLPIELFRVLWNIY